MTRYLSVEQLLRLHDRQIQAFGGPPGLRDRRALEAAVARPQMTFGGEDLHPDLAAKAAVLMHSIVANHPFADGNKRTGVMAAELFLLFNGLALVAGDDDLETATLAVARGEMDANELAIWVRQRTRSLGP